MKVSVFFVCILSLLWSIAEAVNFGSWPILFKVLTLNVTICIVLLHFSNFCFSLSSVADFSELQLQQECPFFYTCEERCGLDMSHGNLSMAVLFSSIEATLKDEQQ